MIINESAKNAIIPDKNSKRIVASQVALNIQGEWDAIDGYMKLIPWFEKYGDQESIEVVEGIVGDEKDHARKLRAIILKYDGDITHGD